MASEQVAESGAVIGDRCEATEAVFVFGPVQCRNDSVTFAIDHDWGTTHVVCEEHRPHPTAHGTTEPQPEERA